MEFVYKFALLKNDNEISKIYVFYGSEQDEASLDIYKDNEVIKNIFTKKELDINTPLAKDKIISGKEFYDIQINYQKLQSSYKAFVQEQLSTWQQELARYKLELSQYKQQLNVVNTDATYYLVKAPTSGIIQGINTRYQGGLLQANETLCTISPEGDLIGECYVPTRDIGLLKVGQPVRYQMQAFDYNYFGVLTGKVAMIDNDFTVINNTPVFFICDILFLSYPTKMLLKCFFE